MEREGKLIDEKKKLQVGSDNNEREADGNGRGKKGGCVRNEVFAHCISLGHINKL